MKTTVLILIILFSLKSYCQKLFFENDEFLIVAEKEKDSIHFTLKNKTDQYLMFDKRNPGRYLYSEESKSISIDFGTDLKSFTENMLKLTVIEPNGLIDSSIKLSSCFSCNKINLSYQFFLVKNKPNENFLELNSSEIAELNKKKNIGKWKWGTIKSIN